MKIRTQFIISTAIFGIILLTIATSVSITNQQLEQTNTQEEVARNLEQEANELSYLSSAYLLYRESQQFSRWESKYASFSNCLSSLSPSSAEQQAVVNNLKANQEQLKTVIAELRATFESTAQTRDMLIDQAFVQVSWSRIEVQNQGMIFDASRLAKMLRDQVDQLKRLNSILIFVLLAALGAFLLANYVLVYRPTLRSIGELQAGTQIIGSGNLDFAIPVERNDEIGELSRAFNRMTASLKGVTASKAELEKEIAQRKKAEDRVRRQKAIQEGVNRILEAALSCDTEEELGRISLSVAEQLTGSKFGFIGEINAQGRLDEIAISDPGWGLCQTPIPAGHRKAPTGFKVHAIYGRVLLDGKGFYTNDPASHPDSIGLPPGHPPLDAFLGVPLAHGGKTIGMVAVGNREGGYRDQDLRALQGLAPAIVQAFLRKRAEEDRERLLVEVQRRAAELDVANKELEAFSYSVSHDLRAPLRHIDGFSQVLLEDYFGQLDDRGKKYLDYVRSGSKRMGLLIDDLLRLSRVTRSVMSREPVNLSDISRGIAEDLRAQDPERQAEFVIAPGAVVDGDRRLLHLALENLVGNAWKFTSRSAVARIEFGLAKEDCKTVFFVRDNGAGFEMAYADKLFGAFQRLHSEAEFPGTGVGLATVQRIIHRHGGRIWAEGEVGKGATFYFTLG